MKTNIKNLSMWRLLQSAQWPYRLALLLTIAVLAGCSWDHVEPDVCFEGEVLPIFVTYCSAKGCHNSLDYSKGYDLTTYEGILHGAKPRRFADSRVVAVMDSTDPKRMPPIGHAQPIDAQILKVKEWVASGAANTRNCAVIEIDTIGEVPYSRHIAPMMLNNCSGCHRGRNAVGGIDLNAYTTVKENAQNGKIQGCISHAAGYVPMPPRSVALPRSDVDTIDKWVAAGAPDN